MSQIFKDLTGEAAFGDIKTFIKRDRCTNCDKTADAHDSFPAFIVAIIRGKAKDNNEPLVRDGIFDEKGKLVKMHACTACGPCLVRFHKLKNLKSIKRLPEGKVKHLLLQIHFRQNGNWEGLVIH